MAIMTLIERKELQKKVEEVLVFSNSGVTLGDLQLKTKFTGTKSAFTRFVKNRFIFNDGKVYLPGGSNTPDVDKATELCQKMARTIDRMAQEIEALNKEIVRLRNLKNAPTLSERAVRALAVYGEK